MNFGDKGTNVLTNNFKENNIINKLYTKSVFLVSSHKSEKYACLIT